MGVLVAVVAKSEVGLKAGFWELIRETIFLGNSA